ncbi:MAG: Crp/Fnr family transcriptional regulator [Betaproteobacteria bacterium]
MSAATHCIDCPLRPLPLFVPQTGGELALVQSLKRRELVLEVGDTLIHEGQSDTRLFTLLEGWAYRFKTLSDGRRQILNFLLAGDFIGVQQKMGDQASHGVVTLTAARLCVFDSDALWELHRNQPSMGFNITWLTAHEESLVDDNLLSIGRRSAEERVATALILLYKRAAALGGHTEEPGQGVLFPPTQQHLADALGMSLAHTNKTLRKLQRRGLFRIAEGRLYLMDPKSLAQLADLYGDGRPPPRPLV